MLPKEDLGSGYRPDWDSLRQRRIPDWFRDAKFGIWAHWGPQSVARSGDWYARHLYGVYAGTEDWERERTERQHRRHLERFGHPAEIGHKDLCHRWRAEKFDPDALMDLYRRTGARYFVSMAAHCDNFDLWDSRHQPWNAVRVGPKSDILGRWAAAARENGLHFGVSMHAGSWTWRWLNSAFGADSSGRRYDGWLTGEDGVGTWWEGLAPRDLYGRPRQPGEPPDADFVANFYARLRDVTEQHRPELIYLDDARLPFDAGSVCEAQPASLAGLEFLADYYNLVDTGVASIKTVPDADRGAVLLDVERGQLDRPSGQPWQFDTSIGDWFYRDGERYKSARQLIHMLVDTVSKNGCLLLNVMQRPDGTIDEPTVAVLEEIGGWLEVCGEAIIGSRPASVFGEGPTRVTVRPGYNEADLPYTARDIRFTRNGETAYVLLMEWPDDGEVVVRSMGAVLGRVPESVALLGRDGGVSWSLAGDGGIRVRLAGAAPTRPVSVLRVV